MTRPAERVGHHPAVTGPVRAESGWWGANRSVMVPAVLLALFVAGVVGAVGRYGVATLLQVAGLAALLVIAAGVAAVGALALVLRRRLQELRHLPDLGRSYVTNHEDALVTGLFRDGAGDVVLEVMSGARQTIVLDESGAPDHITGAVSPPARYSSPGRGHRAAG